MALEPGSRLGPYEIVSLRGKGGMGEVYLARDVRLERKVAIKVLPRELAEDPLLRQRLQREARTISQVRHPHLCALYDIGAEDGVDFLVMEYLEGETLEDRVSRGALPIDEVISIGGQIAEAVAAAHRGGVIHRDLKPGNVMLTRDGAKVLDFGLAKGVEARAAGAGSQAQTVTQSLTTAGSLVGTLLYLAPEQLEGKEADARSDLWALGAVLYQMVTGARPFTGASHANVMAAIMTGRPRAVSELRPEAPAHLEWLIERCLEKSPDRRWQSAGDLALELGSLAEVSEAP
ncbi:MAG TPA: serine/threonine-protein kinase, partial [Thermoanaerobaculia bacterium]|nr:serine/threonine-protein kinase [Thermoanaerobaculia bacterium]